MLFLDEPTSGLDPAGTRDVIELIQSLAGEGRTIVLATHFLGEAGRLADRMAVLHRGRLRAFGRPDDLAAELWSGHRRRDRPGRPGRSRRAGDRRRGARRDRGRVRRRPAPPCASPTATCCRVVVAALVGRGETVYEVASRAPSLEDVYFAIEARILAEHGGAEVTDGFMRDRVPA